MKSNRILSALLATLMLTASFTACAVGDTTLGDESSTQTEAATDEKQGPQDNLPADLSFNNVELVFASNKRAETLAEVAVSNLIGEPVNDAVFERNTAVEKRLGIKIISIEEDKDIVGKVSTAVNAGTADYDAMAAECYITLPKTLEGIFVDLNTTEYLDLTQPYWSQGLNSSISYRDTQYVAAGSMLLSLYRFGFVTVFNKRLFDDSSLPYLYESVQNGTWTLDKQTEIIPLLHRDNGNGTQDLEGDVYGFVSSDFTNVDAYWSACMLKIIDKNAENEYEFVFDTARVFDAAEKLLKLYHQTDSGMYSNFHSDDDWPTIRQMFADGRAAMATFRLLELENQVMRSMVDEFGVAPIPKYDVQQVKYQTLLHDQFTIVAIPTTVTGDRLDAISATLEALSSTGDYLVKPVYYEDTLRTKIAQDPESAEMMNVIVDGVYIDAGILYVASLNYFHHELRGIVQKGQNDATSRFKTKAKMAKNAITKINRSLDRLADRDA